MSLNAFISTERLLLRRPQPLDVQILFSIYSNPETQKHNPAGPLTDISQAAERLDRWDRHWEQHGFGQCAVCLACCEETVIGFGGIGYRRYSEVERLNLGYRLAPSAWGKGYATELATSTLRFAFCELQAPEVFAIVRPGNRQSIRVLERVGMQQVGELDDVPGQAFSLVYRKTQAGRVAVTHPTPVSVIVRQRDQR